MQTPWYNFVDIFDVPVDASGWDHTYIKSGSVCIPNRERFRPALRTTYGLRQRIIPQRGLEFARLKGVYLISYKGRPLYTGHAMGSESILSRLGKHRVKLTGSNWGKGVAHPRRWQTFTQRRFQESLALRQNDRLADFSFSVFPVEAPSRAVLKDLEGQTYRAMSDAVGSDNLLNDPARVKHVERMSIDVAFPALLGQSNTQ
jgi:hypothetical protein